MSTATLAEGIDKLNELSDAQKAVEKVQAKIDAKDKIEGDYKVIFDRLESDDQDRLKSFKSALFPRKQATGPTVPKIGKSVVMNVLKANTTGLTYTEVKNACLDAKPGASTDKIKTQLEKHAILKDEKYTAKPAK